MNPAACFCFAITTDLAPRLGLQLPGKSLPMEQDVFVPPSPLNAACVIQPSANVNMDISKSITIFKLLTRCVDVCTNDGVAAQKE